MTWECLEGKKIRITALWAISNTISRTFFRAKQLGEKGGKFLFAVEIAHKAFILILLSL